MDEDTDQTSGVGRQPLQQVPAGIYIRQPEKKKKKLTKKQQTKKERKIKHNIDVKLGLLPPNTPLKKLTEDEHIEYQQRLINIKNINISRSGARSGLGATVFPAPQFEIPPQYPAQPSNMPVGISAPVSSGYALGGQGQIIPIPVIPQYGGLIGESKEFLRIMQNADNKSADIPINTPQGQIKDEALSGTDIADDTERGSGIKWLKQGEGGGGRRGKPSFPDDQYIGPSPMRSKYEIEEERMQQEKIRQTHGKKKGVPPPQKTDDIPSLPVIPTGTGASARMTRLQNEYNLNKDKMQKGGLSDGDNAELKNRMGELAKEYIQETNETARRSKDAQARYRGREREKKGNLRRSKSQGGDVDAMDGDTPDTRFKTSPNDVSTGVPSSMNQNPLSIIVESIDTYNTESEDAGRIDKPSEPSYVPPSGMRLNMGGELEPIPSPAPLPRSPQDRADEAWEKALQEAGLSPRSPSDPLPTYSNVPFNYDEMVSPSDKAYQDAVSNEFGLAPLNFVDEYYPDESGDIGSGSVADKIKKIEEKSEATKASEFFRDTNFDKKGKLKGGGENLFTVNPITGKPKQGQANSELWWYYQQNLGVPTGEDKQKWENYKAKGGKEGKEEGIGYGRYIAVGDKYQQALEEEPDLTRQVYEYRRAMERQKRRTKKK